MGNQSIRITLLEGGSVGIDIGTFPAAPQVINITQAEAPKPSRFEVRDGMVHDTRTGLTWSQDDAAVDAVSWKKAEEACKALRLGGFDDWRLPSREELLTLVDDTRYDPAIDTSAFPSCKSAWYWTGTAYAASPSDCAWLVDFVGGDSDGYDRGNDGRVRAVRGPSRQ